MNIEELQNHCYACLTMLDENTEWIDRYAGYLHRFDEGIQIEKQKNEKNKSFRIVQPFSKYSCISTSGKLEYDIRLCGQSVATVVFKDTKGGWCLKVDKDKVDVNSSRLGEPYLRKNPSREKRVSILKKPLFVLWNSKDASLFRSVLKEIYENNANLKDGLGSREHLLENVLLEEFKKSKKSSKLLSYIQPVKLKKAFFQMRTPFGASDGCVKYSGSNGGGIDIMARISVKGNKESSLCIMELKDENKESENFEHVFMQALTYASFIAKLLRNEKCGKGYWTYFKPDTNAILEKQLDLYVVCVMPRNDSLEQFVEPMIIPIPELNVNFHLHSLYIEQSEDGKSVKEMSGTLPSIMR